MGFIGYKTDDRPIRGGWAPGYYQRKCCICESIFVGDKRAIMCADCAYKDREKMEPKLELSELEILRAELEKVKIELLEWENREASVCPEGVPFERMLELQEEENIILTRMVDDMAQDLVGIKSSWNPKIIDTVEKYRKQAKKCLEDKKGL
jgi:hypothetical protein